LSISLVFKDMGPPSSKQQSPQKDLDLSRLPISSPTTTNHKPLSSDIASNPDESDIRPMNESKQSSVGKISADSNIEAESSNPFLLLETRNKQQVSLSITCQ
jgi:hypothetical protein